MAGNAATQDLRPIDHVRRNVRAALVGFAILLLPVIAIAGGLAMAPVMAVLGISAALLGVSKSGRRIAPGLWSGAVMALAFWAAISSLWSAYPVPGGWGVFSSNPAKLLIGIVTYISGATAIVFAARRAADRFQRLAIGAVVALAVLALIDGVTGYGLSLAVDPLEEGGNMDLRLRDAEMNLGHGFTIGLLLLGPTIVGAWKIWPDWRGAMIAAISTFGLALGSASIGLEVGILGVFAIILVMVASAFLPRVSVVGSFGLGVIAIVFAPVIARIASGMSDAAKSALPFSWEHRVEGWAFIGERIAEAPLVGHGFDAVRTFDATADIRGYDMSLVSLHPHNAGLHIWVETGLIGAALSVLALIALAKLALEWSEGSRARAMAVSSVVVAAVLVSSISYGVWQEWWWASLFFAAAMCAVLTREA